MAYAHDMASSWNLRGNRPLASYNPQAFANAQVWQPESQSWVLQNATGQSPTSALGVDDPMKQFMQLLNYQMGYNSAEAQKNRDWQELMSNTAHQREVQDLLAAGLNPILGVSQSGASVGSGGVASSNQDMAQLLGSMISQNSAISVAKINKEAKTEQALISLIASVLPSTRYLQGTRSVSHYYGNDNYNGE